MCFTVAILRKGVLMTAEQYYNSLPEPKVNLDKSKMPDFPDMYLVNGFTHPALPVIKNDGIEMYQWGLIPSWVKDASSANDWRTKTLNARGETIFEKPSFKQNIITHRCLLPVSGFYEWRDVNGLKYPYFVAPKDNAAFLVGAVYDNWIDKKTGEVRKTFSILTTEANPLMEMIHNLKKRMPLILSNQDCKTWLAPQTPAEQIRQLIKPYNDHGMKAHTISKIASNVHANRNVKEIMDKVYYSELNEQSLF